MHFSPVSRFVLVAAAMATIAGRAAAAPAHEFLMAPGFIKGKAIAPGERPQLPVLLVFISPDAVEIKDNLKKLEASLAKLGRAQPRVVLVGHGMSPNTLKGLMRAFGLTRMDAVVDPIGIMAGQCGIKPSKTSGWHLRVLDTKGKINEVEDTEAFIKDWQAASQALPGAQAPKDGAKKEEDAALNKKLKEPYRLLKQGQNGQALAHFRSAAGNYKVTDLPTAEEARDEVAKLEKALGDQLEAFKVNTQDNWAADLDYTQEVLAPLWKADRLSKEKIEKFIKERGELEEIKKEYAARKMRLKVVSLMLSNKPDRVQIKEAFEQLAKLSFGTPTGDQAAFLAQVLK